MIEFILMCVVYFAAQYLSKYTMVGNYAWFSNLQNKILLDWNSKFKDFYLSLTSLRIFVCKECNMFWISMLLGAILSIFVEYNVVYTSLFIYLIASSNKN